MFNIMQVVLCTFYVYMINCKQKIQHEDHVVTYQVANPILIRWWTFGTIHHVHTAYFSRVSPACTPASSSSVTCLCIPIIHSQGLTQVGAIVSSGPKNIILLFKYKQCALKTI